MEGLKTPWTASIFDLPLVENPDCPRKINEFLGVPSLGLIQLPLSRFGELPPFALMFLANKDPLLKTASACLLYYVVFLLFSVRLPCLI